MTEQDPPKDSALHVVPGVSDDRSGTQRPVVKRKVLSIDEHVEGVLAGDRSVVGRTFSLMESSNPAHREKASAVLEKLLPHTGKAVRLGITGVPGAGKSTFIEALGTMLTKNGHRVAVLAVDPSSGVSGGSILGDKTRMENLARDPKALVRPSPTGSRLGGVARGTRESIVICEAAGYDVVIVETVGVGQSETQVASMVDFFLLLMIAGAGDELQGIKRGIMELADSVVINKADGENEQRATVARAEYQNALKLLHSPTEGWTTPVQTCSALTGRGVPEVWETVLKHRRLLEDSGLLAEKRKGQSLFWLRQTLEYQIVEHFYRDPRVAKKIGEIREQVKEGRISPFTAAEYLLGLMEEQYGHP